jgi:hypothetical protein
MVSDSSTLLKRPQIYFCQILKEHGINSVTLNEIDYIKRSH